MDAHAYEKELEVATNTARTVGRYLRTAQKGNLIVKQPHGAGFLDVTTSADLKAERMVIDAIISAFPQDHILSEETRNEYSKAWERTWIIDPLDGTTNYVKGLDIYAVSIALALYGQIVMAVVCLPVSGDCIWAVRGHGVFHNGLPLSLATPNDSLEKSLVSIGFPHSRTKKVAAEAFGLYERLWLASSDLRRSASAVYDGYLLAAGITGAYLTPDIKPWDIAAGSLFVEEQGGVTSSFDGEPLDLYRQIDGRFSASVIFAKNVAIHSALKKITASNNAS